MLDNKQLYTWLILLLGYTYQQRIISLYIKLGHPGGGGSLYPSAILTIACNWVTH